MITLYTFAFERAEETFRGRIVIGIADTAHTGREVMLRSRARVVVVTGEPGIGKTRLLTEVAARAVHTGVTVLYGGASEATGMPPYLPFLEALGHYIRTIPAEVRRDNPDQPLP